MYLITLFGIALMFLSIMMVINPDSFADGIISFSKKPYFHIFEVLSRLLFGIVFLYYSDQTRFPEIMLLIGYLLVLVSIILTIIAPTRHKKFALWSASRFKKIFRPAGIGSFFFGLFLVYSSISSFFNS
jgi:hypothetical protein